MQKDLFPMLGNSAHKIFDSGNWSQRKQLIGIQSCIQTRPCASSSSCLSVSNPSEQPHAFFRVRGGKQMSHGAHMPWRSHKDPHCRCKILSYPVFLLLWCHCPWDTPALDGLPSPKYSKVFSTRNFSGRAAVKILPNLTLGLWDQRQWKSQ